MAEKLSREEERDMVNSEKRAQEDRKREKLKTGKVKPRQARLPGTADAQVDNLEYLAEEYYDCGKRRAQLKLDILDEMKRLKKKHYEYNGLEVTVVDGAESVRVKMERDEETAPAE